jgi:vitamin B12 transporter
MRAWGTNEYDGFQAGSDYETDYVEQSVQAGYRQSVNRYWETDIQLGEARDEAANLTDGARTSVFDTRRLEATWENRFFPAPGHTLLAGIDLRDDRIDSTTQYAEDSRYNRAAFGHWSWQGERLGIEAGLRHDDNEAYGAHTTGDLGIGYRLLPELRATASYGTAFKAPTFNQLYFPGFGNPSLDAETSATAELGLLGRHGWGTWELRAFDTRIADLIQTVQVAQFTYRARNVSEARIRGLEASADMRLDGWRIRPSGTVLDAENEDTGNELARRAPATVKLDVERRLGPWTLGGSVIAKDARYDDADNTDRLGGYGLLGLRAAYRIGDKWRIRVSGSNVLDKAYEPVGGYNALGRTVEATLSYGGR